MAEQREGKRSLFPIPASGKGLSLPTKAIMGLTGFLALVAMVAALVDTRAGGHERAKLDELAALARENTAAVREAAAAAKAANLAMQEMARRLTALEPAIAAQRRAAVVLNLEVETSCTGDPDCEATSRAVCARIGYPRGVSSRFTPGPRPLLHSLVCFD